MESFSDCTLNSLFSTEDTLLVIMTSPVDGCGMAKADCCQIYKYGHTYSWNHQGACTFFLRLSTFEHWNSASFNSLFHVLGVSTISNSGTVSNC